VLLGFDPLRSTKFSSLSGDYSAYGAAFFEIFDLGFRSILATRFSARVGIRWPHYQALLGHWIGSGLMNEPFRSAWGGVLNLLG